MLLLRNTTTLRTAPAAIRLTLFITVDLANDDFSRLIRELFLDFVGRLIPDGREHVAETAPIRVEVDEHELGFGWKKKVDIIPIVFFF